MPRDDDHLQPLQDQPLPRAARALSCDHLRRDEQQLEQQQQQDQVCVHIEKFARHRVIYHRVLILMKDILNDVEEILF